MNSPILELKGNLLPIHAAQLAWSFYRYSPMSIILLYIHWVIYVMQLCGSVLKDDTSLDHKVSAETSGVRLS